MVIGAGGSCSMSTGTCRFVSMTEPAWDSVSVPHATARRHPAVMKPHTLPSIPGGNPSQLKGHFPFYAFLLDCIPCTTAFLCLPEWCQLHTTRYTGSHQWSHGALISDLMVLSSVISWCFHQWLHGAFISDLMVLSSVIACCFHQLSHGVWGRVFFIPVMILESW